MTEEQRHYKGAKVVPSINSAGTFRHPHAKKKKDPRHRPYTLTKINSKYIVDLNVKCKTIKVLEDTIGENLDDLGYGHAF